MSRWILVAVLAVLAARGHAQPLPPRAAFEVASVKLNTACESRGGRGGPSPGRLDLPCVSLRALIRMAYGGFTGETLNSRLLEAVGGPAWVDSDRYSVSAKAAGKAPAAQMAGLMLQTLLEERFGVKVHRESRDSAVYALTAVNNKTPKLRTSEEGSCIAMDLSNPPRPAFRRGEPAPKYCGGGIVRGTGVNLIADWYGITMAEFAGRMLATYASLPVIDKTGLTGRFDIHLEFARDNAVSGPMLLDGAVSPGPQASSAESAGPSIFTALREQLGLRLSRTRAPIEVIVIDHADRPSEN